MSNQTQSATSTSFIARLHIFSPCTVGGREVTFLNLSIADFFLYLELVILLFSYCICQEVPGISRYFRCEKQEGCRPLVRLVKL